MSDKSLNVKICLNCKDIWIHRVGMNYCGSCGTSSFEPTHDSNFKVAQNYPGIPDEFEVLRNPHWPIGTNGWWSESYALSKLNGTGVRIGYGRMKQLVDEMCKIKLPDKPAEEG